MSTIDAGSEIDALRQRLIDQADLFDSPANYEAGVRDALDAVAALLDEDLPTASTAS